MKPGAFADRPSVRLMALKGHRWGRLKHPKGGWRHVRLCVLWGIMRSDERLREVLSSWTGTYMHPADDLPLYMYIHDPAYKSAILLEFDPC